MYVLCQQIDSSSGIQWNRGQKVKVIAAFNAGIHQPTKHRKSLRSSKKDLLTVTEEEYSAELGDVPRFLHVKVDQGRVHILLRKPHIALPEITYFARALSLACPFYIFHFHYFPTSKQLT
jgi:hypothetical protein